MPGLADFIEAMESCPPPPEPHRVEFWKGAEVQVQPASTNPLRVTVEIGYSPSEQALCSAVSVAHFRESDGAPSISVFGGDAPDCVAVPEPTGVASTMLGVLVVFVLYSLSGVGRR